MDDNNTQVPAQDKQLQPPKIPMLFVGGSNHLLDSKGRVIIPVNYRKNLGEKFTISLTKDCKGIGVFPNEVFDAMYYELMQLNQRRASVMAYMNALARFTYRDVETDTQGRVLIPTKIREAILKDATKIEICGSFDHIRITPCEDAENETANFFANSDIYMDDVASLLDELRK